MTSSSTERLQYIFTVCFQEATGIKVIGIKLGVYGSLLGIDSVNLHSYRIWGVRAAAEGEEHPLLWAQRLCFNVIFQFLA